jgi:RNA exonuclease 1
MCETTDPVTGVKDKNALIRFSIVNGLDPSQVLLDTLVQPAMPITDLRTRIHGVTEDQLTPVRYTLRHAQAALYNLITDRTIIIGHSVHNDLKALHFNHNRCIDTAYLFNLENEPESMPSLRLVSEQVLGFQLVDSHDSVKDACTSLYAAVHVAKNGSVTNLQRKGNGGGAPGEATLMLHRLPDYCHEEHIMRVFILYTNVVPSKINPIVRGDPTGSEPVGKTTLFFPSQQHADLAFDAITGPLRPDKQNRPQKRIYLKGGGYIYIRK